ncbi:MAG TPA: DNA adenine methylase [Acidimicrobiales bacterium]
MVPPDAPLIKYLGSKRRLVPALTELCRASGARTAVDLFTGTTRVAQAFKGEGACVTAVDSSRTAHVLAQTYVATDVDDPAVSPAILADAVRWLNGLPGEPGYVTETFCVSSRYFQPENGARIDAVRSAIEAEFVGSALWPVLITSLLEAADRVDSTTGLQMAYLKQWADRSYRPMELRVPDLLAGPGGALRGDALSLVAGGQLDPCDLVYLDPPYNQHRYDANYHVWETVIEWDAPDHYGVACKRVDIRDTVGRSPFNSRRTMPDALSRVVSAVEAEVIVLSYNDESWLSLAELYDLCRSRGQVEVLAFDSARYVGARIGIHDPKGRKVGTVSHLRNTEYLLVAGERGRVRAMAEAVAVAGLGGPVGPSPAFVRG